MMLSTVAVKTVSDKQAEAAVVETCVDDSEEAAVVLYFVFEFYSGKCSANIQLDNLHQEQFKATPEKATKG